MRDGQKTLRIGDARWLKGAEGGGCSGGVHRLSKASVDGGG